MSLVGFKAQNHRQQVGKRGAKDKVDDRGTTREFFNTLEERFGVFTLDVAASADNAKCAQYYTIDDDGLSQPWTGRVWCNPPYSDIRPWVQKAWDSPDASLIVMLLPANRTEQGWWQDLIEPQRLGGRIRVEFLRGRLRFDRPGVEIGSKGDRPPFGCCLVIWDRHRAAAGDATDTQP